MILASPVNNDRAPLGANGMDKMNTRSHLLFLLPMTHTPKTDVINSNMPDITALEDALFALLQGFSYSLAEDFGKPVLSDAKLRTSAIVVARYQTSEMGRKRERSTLPLNGAKLHFHTCRTRNPDEEVFLGRVKISQGKKDWWRLDLAEEFNYGKVCILIEGATRRDRADVLEGFMEEVKFKEGQREQKRAQMGSEAEKRPRGVASRSQQSSKTKQWSVPGKAESKGDQKTVKEGKKNVSFEDSVKYF